MGDDDLIDNGDGSYTDSSGNIYDGSGNLIGNVDPMAGYIDNGDGTYTDPDTGITVDANGQDVNTPAQDDGSGLGDTPITQPFTDPISGTTMNPDGSLIFADGTTISAAGVTTFSDGSSLSPPDANGDSTFVDAQGTSWTSMASAGAPNLWQNNAGTVWNSSSGVTTYPVGVTPNYTDPSTLTKNADGSYSANTGTQKPPSSSGGGGGSGLSLGGSSGGQSSLNDLAKTLSQLLAAQQGVTAAQANAATNPLALAQAQAALAKLSQQAALGGGSLSSLFSGTTGTLLLVAGLAAVVLLSGRRSSNAAAA